MKSTEGSLIQAALAGDPQAFGQLVDRHYQLVCAVAYSIVGRFDLSEDICQETFLAAWRERGQLKESRKLRSWLCGIARNLAQNACRRRLATATAEGERQIEQAVALQAGPSDQAISREQEAILWQSLERIPPTYREPLVLYYRQQQSVAAVATALDLSEEAVRQRLVRGRRMLEEQVQALVESALTRSAPKPTLAVMIVSALPGTASKGGVATAVTAAAKGSGALKGVALAAVWGSVLGYVVGGIGACIGVWASLRSAQSARERRFIIRSTIIIAAYVHLALILMLAGGLFPHLLPGKTLWILRPMVWVLYPSGLIGLVVWANRRTLRIRKEEGATVQQVRPTETFPQAARRPRTLVGACAGGVFGAVAWIVVVAISAGDWGSVATMGVLTMALLLLTIRSALWWPERVFSILAGTMATAGTMNLLVLNLRWSRWQTVVDRMSPLPGMPPADLSRGTFNLILGVLFGGIVLLLLVMARRSRLR